jgi:putative tryptophan/tyrosine transport system substrate-binding protein
MTVGRREFITLLGGASALSCAAWPLAVRAQRANLVRNIGLFINTEEIVEPFRCYMKALGWEEGRNIRFLFARTEGHSERASALAGDLVAHNVDLIVPMGDPAIRAVQRATQAIPIVGMADDMIGSGLAASLARPGGNMTGVSILASELDVKRLEILHEFVPQARRIAVLADPTTISTRAQLTSAARDLGVELVGYLPPRIFESIDFPQQFSRGSKADTRHVFELFTEYLNAYKLMQLFGGGFRVLEPAAVNTERPVTRAGTGKENHPT